MKGMIMAAGLLWLTVGPVAAQSETTLVHKSAEMGGVEEYEVLKDNKLVRQGSYVRYRPASVLAGVALFEVGRYERSVKVGEWRTYHQGYPWNKLRSKGSYHAGQAEGLWYYYHQGSAPSSSQRGVLQTANPRDGFTVDIDDTTAVVQAKGMWQGGHRVGLWTYYDLLARPVQKINYSTGQLLYWRRESGEELSGAATSVNHPLLYVGGNNSLQSDVVQALDAPRLLLLEKSGSAEFIVSVDTLGRPTSVAVYPATASPTKYQRLLLSGLQSGATHWLPKCSNGQPVPATAHLRIATTYVMENNWKKLTTIVKELPE